MNFTPTYDTYRKILLNLRSTGKLMDYTEAKRKPMFIVLRHDIEFSVERAMSMSLIESAMDICSTYFVQIRSNAYNAFSSNNIDMLRDMHKRGHHIGLHYHIGESMNPAFVTREITEQCDLLEKMLGIPVDRYSMHRPQKETGYYETDIPGKLNAYGSSFFTYAEKVDASAVLNVKYILKLALNEWQSSYNLQLFLSSQALYKLKLFQNTILGCKDNDGSVCEEKIFFL